MAILDLIWSLINFAAILYFFYLLIGLIFRGRKSFQNQPTVLSFPILIIGSLAILASSPAKEDQLTIIDASNKVEHVNLTYSSLNKVQVQVISNKTSGAVNQTDSNSILSGLVLGRKWEHLSLEFIERELRVKGRITYSFFGIAIFSTILTIN
ncbi:MAG: hypothetical protein ACI9UV_000534 [Algoriphagus sp.]|jgi:hypothetical protein